MRAAVTVAAAVNAPTAAVPELLKTPAALLAVINEPASMPALLRRFKPAVPALAMTAADVLPVWNDPANNPPLESTEMPPVAVFNKRLATLAAVAVAFSTSEPAVNVLTFVVVSAAVDPTPLKFSADAAAVHAVTPVLVEAVSTDPALKPADDSIFAAVGAAVKAVSAVEVEPECADTAIKAALAAFAVAKTGALVGVAVNAVAARTVVARFVTNEAVVVFAAGAP